MAMSAEVRFCGCEDGRRRAKLEASLRDAEERVLGAPAGDEPKTPSRGIHRERRVWERRREADAVGDGLREAEALAFLGAEGGASEETPHRFRLEKSDVGVPWLPHEQRVSAAIAGVAVRLACSAGPDLQVAAHHRMDEMLLLLLTQVVQETLDKRIFEDLLHLA